MSFLAGWVSAAPPPLSAQATIRARLAHRGAAGAGWLARSQGRGCTLLLGGAVAEAAPFTLAFDGALTNRAALVARLAAAGHGTPTHDDAAAVVAGWRAWGAGVLPWLEGAFAFAVHDAGSGTVTLVRDRFGERPLLLAVGERQLAFATELAALLAWPGVPRTPDLEVLALMLGRGHAPARRSPIAGVRPLPPGHSLVIRANGTLDEAAWWSLPSPAPASGVPALRALVLDRVRAAASGATRIAGLGGAGEATLAACLGQPQAIDAAPPPPTPALVQRLVRHGGGGVRPEELAPGLALPPASAPVLAGIGAAELLLAHRRYRIFARDLERLREGGRPAPRPASGFVESFAGARDLWHAASGGMDEASRLALSGPALLHTLVFAVSDDDGTALDDAAPGRVMATAAMLDMEQRIPARDLAALDTLRALTGATIICPFLDSRLVTELAAQPDAARRFLMPTPSAGSAPDLAAWHPMGPALREFTRDTLLGAPCRQRALFSHGRVAALLRDESRAPGRDTATLWSLLGLELWCRCFLDGGLETDMPVLAAAA